MRLDATWLTTPELLRIASYCHQLRALKLSDCPLPTKALSTLLQSLRRLSRLSLDIPLRDYSADAEEGDDDEGDGGAAAAEYREEDERTRGRIFHRDELGENGIMKAVEMYASSETLEYLELTFQSSIRISVKAICLLLKCQRSLRTLKLVDADIEDPQSSRRSTKIKKKKAKDDYRKKEGRHSNRSNSANGEASSTAVASPGTAKSGPGSSAMSSAALSAASPTASSTASSGISGSLSGVGSPSPSTSPTPSISDNDDSGDGGTELPPTEWKETDSSFGLHFLSISSSHTSDSSLAHILEHCPQLRALHLHSCDTITDQSLQAMVQHCPQLESISLSSCKGLTTQGLDQFFREKGQAASAGSPLVHVHLCDLAALHDETLEILAACHGRSLLKLAIYFCGFVTDKGVIALLTTCSRLRVFGLQAYGMTPAIFEQPWASSRTIEQLDLQGVFKKVYLDPSGAAGAATANNFSATAMWQDRQARIDGFAITKARVITLDRLKNLRLAAGGIGKEVLGGFAPSQRIEVLHLYGLQSTQVDTLPWTAIKTCYPYLKQVYCGVVGVIRKSIRDELVRLNVELLASSSIPDLAFENNFDD
ncbi:hypothetical protein BG015_010370 [Linnemannia schmuckeri]|uniref:RNI-like protein n=1 Tax=Linnemannia schmuckeri TaxID=64567 RepID=A0A9P5RU81_9FUNG|nr:hypothetical protein BG015_010370 [Linnemannia schmuckeri]